MKDQYAEGIIANEAFCLMPWIHLHVNTSGLCQACCIAPITFGNVNKQSIEEIWEGDRINTFRRNLLSGYKDKRCRGCYQLEESGVKSIRQETLEKFSHKLDQLTFSDNSSQPLPIYLDIRFSNVCNFRCVTCWHGASSKWFEEAKVSKTNVAETAIIKALDNEESFFEQLEWLIDDVEEFYFAGGEPLVMEEHYKVLDLLLQKKKTEVHLRYNTNLSLLHFKERSVVDYWRHFDKVTVSASLDAAGSLGEEIRRDSSWAVIKSNLRSIRKACPHVKLEIAPTISSLNVHAVPALHQELVDDGLIGIDDIYTNILTRPRQYHVGYLDNKNEVIDIWRLYTSWLRDKEASFDTIRKANEVTDCLNT